MEATKTILALSLILPYVHSQTLESVASYPRNTLDSTHALNDAL
jgi:hypothetical protein